MKKGNNKKPPRGNVGPVIFASTVCAKPGEYLSFEEWPELRAVILRRATKEEFLASRRERQNGKQAPASLLRRLDSAHFYEIHAD